MNLSDCVLICTISTEYHRLQLLTPEQPPNPTKHQIQHGHQANLHRPQPSRINLGFCYFQDPDGRPTFITRCKPQKSNPPHYLRSLTEIFDTVIPIYMYHALRLKQPKLHVFLLLYQMPKSRFAHLQPISTPCNVQGQSSRLIHRV